VIDSVATAPDNYAVLVDVDGNPVVFVNETGVTWDLLSRVVEYSIGSNSPAYDNRVSRRLSGQFTKTIQQAGRILLPAKPTYLIRDVYITDDTDPDLSVTGRITFLTRVNTTPAKPQVNPGDPLDPALLQYQVTCHNPEESQSGYQVMELVVGCTGEEDRFDGKTLHVVYDSLVDYDTIWSYMTGADHRLTCATNIPRGLHPVYLSMSIGYSLAKNAIASLDESAAKQSLAAYINTFSSTESFDVTDVVAHLRSTYDVIGRIEPITIYYKLYAPDGRVIYYKTTDQLVIDTSKYDTTYSGDPNNTLDEPISQGVSDDVVRYLTTEDMITFTAV